MRSRIVQDESGPGATNAPTGGPSASRESRRNLAARAAHWSANHRKAAIWGWLAIVFLLAVAFMGGEVLKQK
jgi:hypothetical protein